MGLHERWHSSGSVAGKGADLSYRVGSVPGDVGTVSDTVKHLSNPSSSIQRQGLSKPITV
eukprot:3121829-Rhodomonas_salina.2